MLFHRYLPRLATLRPVLAVLLSVILMAAPEAALSQSAAIAMSGPAAAAAAAAVAPTATEQIINSLPEAQAKWTECYKKCRTNHQECSANVCAQQCRGEVVNKAYNVAGISQIMNYNVNAAFAASCIEKFSDYVKTIRDAAKKAHDLGLSLDTLIVKTIVDAIIDAVLTQIFNSITNAVCNITNEALNALDSFAKNAICLPQMSLGNPLDFKLDLGRLQCDGWSVNALTGQVNGQPVAGVSVPSTSFGSGYDVTNPSLSASDTGPATIPLDTTTLPKETQDLLNNPLPTISTTGSDVTVPPIDSSLEGNQ